MQTLRSGAVWMLAAWVIVATARSSWSEGEEFEVAQLRPGARVEAVPGGVGHLQALDGSDETFWQPRSATGELTRYFEVPLDLHRLEMKTTDLQAYTVAVAQRSNLHFETLIDRRPATGEESVEELEVPGARAVRLTFHGRGWPRVHSVRIFSTTSQREQLARRSVARRRGPFVAVANGPGHWRAKPHRHAVRQALDELRWPGAEFSSEQWDELCARTGDFDIVLLNTMCQFPGEEAPLQAAVSALKGFVDEGGILVVFDVESDERAEWTALLGQTFRLRAGRGAVGESTGMPVHLDAPGADVLNQPYAIPRFAAPPAHIMVHSEGWGVLASDPEGYPVLLERSLGEGVVVACSAQPGGVPLRELLTNLWAKAVAKRSGIVVRRLHWPGVAYGRNEVQATISNTRDQPRRLRLRLAVEGADHPAVQEEVELPPGGTHAVSLVVLLTQRQRSTLVLEISSEETLHRFHSPPYEIPELLTAEIASPRYRASVYATDPDQTVTVAARLTPVEGGRTLHASLHRAAGLSLQEHHILPDPDGNTVVFDLSGQGPGEYTVRVWVTNGQDETMAEKELPLTRLAPGPHEVIIDRHGRTLVDGRPFFPLGLYRIPGDRLAEFRQAGFNTAVAVENLSPEYVTRAGKADLMVAALYWGDQQTLEKHLDHHNILAWYISDEPGGRDWTHPSHTLSGYRETVKTDPYRPVLLVDNGYDDHTRGCDILAPDIYPITWSDKFHTNNGIWEIARKLRQARSHPNTRHKAMWAVLQALNPTEWYALPSQRQTRAMAYGAICLGATGLLWYAEESPEDPNWRLSESAIWADVTQTVQELRELSPVLLSAERPPEVSVRPELPELLWTVRRYQDADYLIAVNWHPTYVTKVFDFADGREATAHECLSKSRRPIEAGRLVTVLAPLEVARYRIARGRHGPAEG